MEGKPSRKERSTPASVKEMGVMAELKDQNPGERYLKDQRDTRRGGTDLRLVCEDGFVPVHRYILMGVSTLVNHVLSDLDPYDPAVINLPDVKLCHLLQVVSLVYCGKSVIGDSDQAPVFEVMKMLGMSGMNFEFRQAKPTDQVTIPTLRSYRTQEEGEVRDEMEQTYVNMSLISADMSLRSATSSKTMSSVTTLKPDQEEFVGFKDTKSLHRPSLVIPERHTLSKLRVGHKDERKSQSSNTCAICLKTFSSMEHLLAHLSQSCAQLYNSKYNYNTRQCLICLKQCKGFNVWALLHHVRSCMESCQQKLGLSQSEALSIYSKNRVSDVMDSNMSPVVQVLTNGISFEELSPARGKIGKIALNETNGSDQSGPLLPPPLLAQYEENNPHINEGGELLIPQERAAANPPRKRRRRQAHGNKNKRRKTRQNGLDQDVDTDATVPKVEMDSEALVEVESLPVVMDLDKDKDKDGNPAEGLGIIRIVEMNSLGEPSSPLDEGLSPEFLVETVEVESANRFLNVSPDHIRNELGINSPEDFLKLQKTDLLTLFRTCPLCKSTHERIKYVSKCLRSHGYRYCWVCLKLLPYKGRDFDRHNKAAHCIGNSDKVKCPLCPKEFEYKLGLPTHYGNYHGVWPEDKPACDVQGDPVAPSIASDAGYEVVGDHPNPLVVRVGTIRTETKSKLRDILTAPSTSSSTLASSAVGASPLQPEVGVGSNGSRTTRRQSAVSNERDERLIPQLGEKLMSQKKVLQEKRRERPTMLMKQKDLGWASDSLSQAQAPAVVFDKGSVGVLQEIKMEKASPRSSSRETTPAVQLASVPTASSFNNRRKEATNTTLSTQNAQNVPAVQNQNAPAPTQEGPPRDVTDGKVFLHQRPIAGIVYDIFCQVNDRTKTIAVPAKYYKQ